MIVKRIARKGERYVKIEFLDGETLTVAKEIALDRGLRANDVLTEEEREDLRLENDRFLVRSSAYRALARRPHLKAELRRKLRQKRFDEGIIEETLEDLDRRGYLNDEEFAERYFEERALGKQMGAKKIAQELLAKGASRETVERAASAYPEKDQLERAVALGERKLARLAGEKDPLMRKAKLSQFLYGKGYDYDTIGEALHRLGFDD
ncbi:MAG: hypothetical protein GF419_02825 [Ignavibacteriales bacterium]|nr:hypothetical protein [Ignavibacteriales bacterium]